MRITIIVASLVVAATFLGCSDDDSANNNQNNVNTNAVCGNGVVEPGEQCDDGESNSDTAPDACRSDCRSAYCGDGVIDTSEGCDGEQLGGETCSTVDATFTGGVLRCGSDCSFDTSSCAVCGNDAREPTEDCDGADVGSATCSDLTGLQQGIVTCTAQCGYDTSDCHSCGNDIIEGNETCEGEDLGGLTCELLGYAYGTLNCGSDCQFDEGQCHSVCGNGIREPGEACDGADFGGADCSAMGMVGGQLRCTAWCTVSLEDCTSCGDGVQDPNEECDGADFGGEDCASLGSSGSGGTLACTSACRIETAGCTADASCGDGILDAGEQCDGNALGGQDCVSAYPALYGGGNLACSSACLFDTAGCTPIVACGNGQAEPSLGEQCDGQDLDGQTCQSLGFPGGVIACGTNCGYDTSGCDTPVTCGNGVRETGEACDGGDLGGATCQTIGFVGGTLTCRGDCSYDTSACDTCGDGLVNGDDECDGVALGGETCMTLGYYGGTLSCNSGCRFNTTNCEAAGWCGDGVLQPEHGEQCDDQEFGSDSCIARGFDGGALQCGNNCHTETTACSSCGDGICGVGEPGTCQDDCLLNPVSTGGGFSCAISTGGSLSCWGDNNFGELGNTGISTGQCYYSCNPSPSGVSGINSVVAVESGASHACALTDAGTVYCWGNNSAGQLGVGSGVGSSDVPILVSSISNVVDISAGTSFTCAVTGDGLAWCWGYNSSGQIGDNSIENRYTPTQVYGLVDIAAIAAGEQHACAVDSAGQVWCWGDNGTGKLGNGNQIDSLIPVQTLMTGAVDIDCSATHTCALTLSSTVWCWGNNQNGQLGNGNEVASFSPQYALGLSNAVGLSVGVASTCAVDASGFVWCWGQNVGDGTDGDSSVPSLVDTLIGATHVSTYGQHACARLSSGEIWCWGSNGEGELGTGLSDTSPTAVQAVSVSDASGIDSGWFHSLVLRTDSTVVGFGNNQFGQIGTGTVSPGEAVAREVVGLSGVTGIAAGGYHSCAVKSDGTAWCWGRNIYGELGDAQQHTTCVAWDCSPSPVRATSITDLTDIAGGTDFTCARRADGTVWCWGLNSNYQLGDGQGQTHGSCYSNRDCSYQAVQVSGLVGVSRVKAGNAHACALLTDRTLWCWGANGKGQLGKGDTSVALTASQVTDLQDVVEFGLGDKHTCAIRGDGTAWCWGYGGQGQLGDGSRSNTSVPVQVASAGTASIAGGSGYTCGVLGSGPIVCWGSNRYGQLGNGQYNGSGEQWPVTALGINNAVWVSGSARTTCAVLSDRTVWCWGEGAFGQLGREEYTQKYSPVQVLGL